jgi:uncharacterized protein with GYD domain
MAKFVIFFSYTPEAWKAMLDKPSDRAAAASQIAEAVGGTVESYYWMFGDYDGFAIAEMPDSVSAGAVSVAVSSSGAIARASTHELLDADGRDALIEKAKTAVASYSPPTG